MNKQGKAYIFALLSVFFWSTVATAFKLTLRYTTPYSMLLGAASFSTFFLFIVILASKKKVKFSLKIMLLGLLNPMLYYMLLFEAYNRLLAQQALCINYLWPVVLVIFSVISGRERLSIRGIFGILLGFTGVIIVSTRGNINVLFHGDMLGVVFALLSTFVWAYYWSVNRVVEMDSVVKLFQGFLFSLPFIFLIVLLDGGLVWNKKAILGSLYIGLFEMGFTFFLWLKALENADKVQRIASLIYLAPPLSLVIIHFILQEPIYISTILGFILVLSGVLISKSEITETV